MELIAVLKKFGFVEIRQRGSHMYLRHQDGRATVVPVHPGHDIGRGLLRKILREAEISREEFMKFLN